MNVACKRVDIEALELAHEAALSTLIVAIATNHRDKTKESN